MLLEKLQEHKNFTAHEKDVAEYILSHLDQISELSAGELAKASYTSKATVVRLSQKLGLNGFQDLKITLTAEINQKKADRSTACKRAGDCRKVHMTIS